MSLSEKAVQYVTALTYPVQFESDIGAGVDRVLLRVVAPTPTRTREEYVLYIKEVLDSDTDLKEIDPGAHEDQAIRSFLSKIKTTLETQIESERAAHRAAMLAAQMQQRQT
jgi:hypothetical protein